MAMQKQKQKASTELFYAPRKTGKIEIPEFKDVPRVKGVFKNIESPGMGISFPFRGNWKGPVQQFTFYDGLEYEIPRELADHLNDNCAYVQMKWVAPDGTESTAKPIESPAMPEYRKEINKKISRFMFQITG